MPVREAKRRRRSGRRRSTNSVFDAAHRFAAAEASWLRDIVHGALVESDFERLEYPSRCLLTSAIARTRSQSRHAKVSRSFVPRIPFRGSEALAGTKSRKRHDTGFARHDARRGHRLGAELHPSQDIAMSETLSASRTPGARCLASLSSPQRAAENPRRAFMPTVLLRRYRDKVGLRRAVQIVDGYGHHSQRRRDRPLGGADRNRNTGRLIRRHRDEHRIRD